MCAELTAATRISQRHDTGFCVFIYLQWPHPGGSKRLSELQWKLRWLQQQRKWITGKSAMLFINHAVAKQRPSLLKSRFNSDFHVSNFFNRHKGTHSKQNAWLLMISAPLMGQCYFGAILLGRVGNWKYSVSHSVHNLLLRKKKMEWFVFNFFNKMSLIITADWSLRTAAV